MRCTQGAFLFDTSYTHDGAEGHPLRFTWYTGGERQEQWVGEVNIVSYESELCDTKVNQRKK